MKPEWCPQEIWVAAQSEADQYVEWLIPKPKEYSQSEHVLAVSFARVILDAHQRGRREGMEEAASLLERLRSWIEDEVGAELPFTEAEQSRFEAIRAKMEVQP